MYVGVAATVGFIFGPMTGGILSSRSVSTIGPSGRLLTSPVRQEADAAADHRGGHFLSGVFCCSDNGESARPSFLGIIRPQHHLPVLSPRSRF